MARPIPVPNEFNKPFWDAVNEKKLVVQKCKTCGQLQYPPKRNCMRCNGTTFDWHQVQGRGHVDVGFTIRDSRIRGFREMQPINFAIITLDEDPALNFLSNLPGTPAGTIPIGAPVELIFEEVAPGRLLHEWKVVK